MDLRFEMSTFVVSYFAMRRREKAIHLLIMSLLILKQTKKKENETNASQVNIRTPLRRVQLSLSLCLLWKVKANEKLKRQ